jgi:RNA polymerase sigma factor (sigma-70 family)
MRLIKLQYKSLSDEQLAIEMSKGDKRAFDELYGRYSSALISYFVRMLWKDRELAEDFLHDIFTKLIRKPELFDPSRSFKTWIFSVANNMCKNEYKRREVRKNTVNGLDSSYNVKDTQRGVLTEVHENEFGKELERSLRGLDEKHSEVFVLRHMDGLSIKEIAEVLEISDGTVKSRLFYATKYLAKSLEHFNPVITR